MKYLDVEYRWMGRTASFAMLGVAVMCLLAWGCGDDENGNGGNGESERPAGSADIISDSQLDVLAEAGADIHYGYNPPEELEGYWWVDDPVITYDENSSYIGSSREDAEFYFHDFTGKEIQFEWWHPDQDTEAMGGGAYISGEDGCYTIYSDSVGSSGDCEIESVDVFSGCMSSSDTIEDFQMSFMLLDKSGDASDCDQLMDVESPRVVENEGPVHRMD